MPASPSAAATKSLTPAFDVNLRNAPTIGGQKLDNYMGGSTVTAVITLSSCPAMALPCGFDQFGRPVGLQLVGNPLCCKPPHCSRNCSV